MKIEGGVITNELLLALLNQLYSIELLLADAYAGKANMRYSNTLLDKDEQVLLEMTKLVNESIKEENMKVNVEGDSKTENVKVNFKDTEEK